MEARKVIHNVKGINGGHTTSGTLRLMDFHMVFCVPSDQSEGTPVDAGTTPKTKERWVTYPMLSYCAFRPSSPTSRQAPSLRIRCRDFTFVTFNFEDNDVAREVFHFVRTRTCKLGTVEKLFAFNHKPLESASGLNGWDIFDPKAEFRRQGISGKLQDKGWRITNINKDYNFCDTYPAVLVVPSKISDNVLKYAKEFRSRNRIPALSYMHPVNNCTITRSSQPLAGITMKNNVQDEKLVAASFSAWVPGWSDEPPPKEPSPLEAISENSIALEPELSEAERYEEELISRSSVMYDVTGEQIIYGRKQINLIVDARPAINAMVNQVQGRGSENMDKYPFAKKSFLSIENIHVMRNSLNKVIEVLKDADISPLPPNQELLNQSGWLQHIYSLLDGSAIVARRIGIKHSHVLIHCSDGWDRTSQLSALAQIMLDPYYRTLDGFIVLIEKDWLSFGHMFRLRSGHLNHEDWFMVQGDALAGAKAHASGSDGCSDALQSVLSGAKRFFSQNRDDADPSVISEAASGKIVDDEATKQDMVSPIFHQFLDCTYQLLRQNKDRFEFNERFLRRLLYHLYSSQYGTFLFNSEKQRMDARVRERTSSVWDYFLYRRVDFTNPDYNPIIDDRVRGRERILLPSLKDIRWWYQIFGRTDEEMNGCLNAAAEAEKNRQVEITQINNSATSGSAVATPRPLWLGFNRSVLTAVETAHENLATVDKQRSLRHSGPSTRASRGVISSLQGRLGSLGIGRGLAPQSGQDSEEELQKMA